MKKRFLGLILAFCMLLGMFPIQALAARESETVMRDITLIVDIPTRVDDNYLAAMKEEIIKFCKTILEDENDNYIGIVYSSGNMIVNLNTFYTNDINMLIPLISDMSYRGITKTDEVLDTAINMETYESRPADQKQFVYITTGLPQNAKNYDPSIFIYDNPYTSADHSCYAYADAAVWNFWWIKSLGDTYTVGYFPSLSGEDLEFGKRFLTEGQNSGVYNATGVIDLNLAFNNILKGILGYGYEGVYEEEDPNTDNPANKPITQKDGTFNFPSGSDGDSTAEYHYKDSYFSKVASNYQPSLATMSLCLAMSAFGSNIDGKDDYTNKSRNAKALLQEIGFEDIETNDFFTIKPSEDSIGVIVGHKDIIVNGKETTLITLVTRGGGYEAEWAGNFTVGLTGQHQGFATARDEAYRFLNSYIEKYKNKFKDEEKLQRLIYWLQS